MKKTHTMITIGILALLFGSIAIGLALSADNLGILPMGEKNPDDTIYTNSNLSETEVEAILATIPEITEFLAQFEEVELYLFFDPEYELWYALYFVIDDFYSYALVVLDDITAEVILVETFIASGDSNLTEEQVLNIALSNEKVQEFVTDHPDYEVYVYYDYFQYWYVDFYDNYYYSWCSALIDDVTGEIIEVYSSDDFYETELTVDEVVDIALADLDVQQFIIDHPEYEMYVYLTEFYDTFDTDPEMDEPFYWTDNITWIVGFSSLDYMDWMEVWIDDSTGEIIDKWMTTPATKTAEEIFDIANSTVEVQEFLAQYEDAFIDVWYDGFGTWHVWIWSEVQWDAYCFLEIDDLTGEILYIDQYLPVPPQHDESEVLAVVMALTEVIDFINDNPEYEMWLYFYDGLWYVDIYSIDYCDGIWIMIDDYDLTVLSIETYQCEGPVDIAI